ncbi:hypothetical protein [Pseudomonas sp. 91RF]|jgi:hypothetical protein|uniref:hypothetical protein n=1 Tax=Pseudomonas sp. 91RF TaxID=2292261 RepID=UPI0021140A1F|nr:hypothetical protein [Pseudomonas sp. 91RF]
MFAAFNASRLFGAITLVFAVTPAFAAWTEAPQASWQYYSANCQRMLEKMADVQSGRTTAFEIMFALEDNLRVLDERRPNLTPEYLSFPRVRPVRQHHRASRIDDRPR